MASFDIIWPTLLQVYLDCAGELGTTFSARKARGSDSPNSTLPRCGRSATEMADSDQASELIASSAALNRLSRVPAGAITCAGQDSAESDRHPEHPEGGAAQSAGSAYRGRESWGALAGAAEGGAGNRGIEGHARHRTDAEEK
jgi:hypothetical protein